MVESYPEKMKIRLAFYQIYKENVTDLLGKDKKIKLNIRVRFSSIIRFVLPFLNFWFLVY